MKSKCLIIIFLFLYFCNYSYPQEQKKDFNVLFYNVENLFDTSDDALTADDEFTPSGDRHWTRSHLDEKLLNISKVILSSPGWMPPDIVALCEIENRTVLEKLLEDTPLKALPFKIIHKESPDERGIDVALFYNSDRIYPVEYRYYSVESSDMEIKTRDILYFSGIINENDTLHFFVNHWPSRFDGLLETTKLREVAAKVLKEKVDEIFSKHNNPKIIILGDFNDQPGDESIDKILLAQRVSSDISPNLLYNLSAVWLEDYIGTIKYQSQWSVFDQIIVSGSLLNADSGVYTSPENASIVELPFLFEDDERYGGVKPFRSYDGYTYRGGFSDHLPVILKIESPN